MQQNNSFRYIIRILAGAYLLYLSWNLIAGMRSGEAPGFVFIIASVVFAMAGVFFILDALRHIHREALDNREEQQETDFPEENENETSVDTDAAAEENISENDSKALEEGQDGDL